MAFKFVSVILIVCFFIQTTKAQDNHFSQYYANPMFVNPAFTGTGQSNRLSLNYRNQWPELNKAFVSYAVAFDLKATPGLGGFGVSLLRDVIAGGEITANQLNVLYAYPLKLNNNWSISFGIQASFIQKSLNWSQLVFPDMIDPVMGSVLQTNQNLPEAGLTRKSFDFSTGILANSDQLFLGLSVHHLNSPPNNLYKSNSSSLETKYSLQIGGVLKTNTSSLITDRIYYYPNIILQKQGAMQQINYGFYAKKNVLVGGLWFRQNFNMQADALIFLAGFYFKNVKLSYSYDLPISSLLGYAYSAHELTASVMLNPKKYSMSLMAVPCPEF